MATKVKIQREFTFKAYVVDADVINPSEITSDAHCGEYFYKSECHYYCEKAVLDFLKANQDQDFTSKIYLIYKVCTVEDNKTPDMLLETITMKDGKINIC